MRALSLSQPWADVVVKGPKRIENRPLQLCTAAARLKRSGELFAIHAAKSFDHDARRWVEAAGVRMPTDWIGGAIIGVARVVDVAQLDWWTSSGKLPADQVPWAFGPLCILLGDVSELSTPVPCRGMLGFWTVPAELAAQVTEQLGSQR